MEISVTTILGNRGPSAQLLRINSAIWEANSCRSTWLAEWIKAVPQLGQWSCLLARLKSAPQLSQTYTIYDHRLQYTKIGTLFQAAIPQKNSAVFCRTQLKCRKSDVKWDKMEEIGITCPGSGAGGFFAPRGIFGGRFQAGACAPKDTAASPPGPGIATNDIYKRPKS